MPKDGTSILQPGRADGGRTPADAVGSLFASIAPVPHQPNLFDAAFALLTSDDAHNRPVGSDQALGPVRAINEIPEDLQVEKVGRSTGRTTGIVSGFNVDALVWYDDVQIRFVNQLEITGTSGRFSSNGDSGSVVWAADDHRSVGLIFAASPSVAYASPLEPVLKSIGVDLV